MRLLQSTEAKPCIHPEAILYMTSTAQPKEPFQEMESGRYQIETKLDFFCLNFKIIQKHYV
jgi:hypothetical protein